MPVHRYGVESRHDRDDLVGLLAGELLADQGRPPVHYDSPDDAPSIYIDEGKMSDSLRITVVWSCWFDVPEVQRAAIILDAFDKAGRKSERDRISVALGVTPEEADALGMELH